MQINVAALNMEDGPDTPLAMDTNLLVSKVYANEATLTMTCYQHLKNDVHNMSHFTLSKEATYIAEIPFETLVKVETPLSFLFLEANI